MAGDHGRTQIQQEIVSPNGGIIGENIELETVHDSAVRETEGHGMKQKCRNDYCCRITDMIKWMKDNYPSYYSQGVIELTPEQKADKIRYRKTSTQTHDLIYNRLNVKMIKAYMSAKRFKSSGKEYGFDHMRKYKDAVKFGSKRAKQPLPQNFEVEMVAFLGSLKNKKRRQKRMGNWMRMRQILSRFHCIGLYVIMLYHAGIFLLGHIQFVSGIAWPAQLISMDLVSRKCPSDRILSSLNIMIVKRIKLVIKQFQKIVMLTLLILVSACGWH